MALSSVPPFSKANVYLYLSNKPQTRPGRRR
jgi:hypothetical protein